MQRLTFNKTDLLVKLKENREQHRSVFLEAIENYRKEAIAELERQLGMARDGITGNFYVSLTQPLDMTKNYDRIIQMMEMSSEESIVLDEKEFQNYVMDKWNWSKSFASSAKGYAVSAASQSYLSRLSEGDEI
jgi:hypothetical protein